MCLLIAKPPGKTIPFEHLENGFSNNPHGCGISYPARGKMVVKKKISWKAKDVARELAKIGDAPALVHFRYATHGSKNDANTHPFLLPGNVWAAAHNGVIHGMKARPDESDTRAFLRSFVVPAIRKIKDAKVQFDLEQIIGTNNKIVLLNADGEFVYLNKDKGEEHEGIWYSNNQYSYNWKGGYDYDESFYGNFLPSKFDISPANEWRQFDISDMQCCYCGAHVWHMGFAQSLKINSKTGDVCCSDCYAHLIDY